MRGLLKLILTLIVIQLLLHQCANPSSPTGGPRDSIPPTLLASYPITGTTQFNEQELRFEFSEFISADKLKQELIITPKLESQYKSVVRKNKLILKFDEPFKDSTTYSFNFADGVTDITERNPSVNLSMAFSTGTFIDSMSFKGTIEDLFDQQPLKGYTVALYEPTDTLDFFTDSPIYFATSNDSGKFELNYLKTGIYKILAFNDENRNILLDPDTEEHGFLEDPIDLFSPVELDQPIRTLLQNVKPITFINARPTGPYVEVKYSKTINSYSIEPDTLNHNLIGESKDAIRLYRPNTIDFNDSTQIIVNVLDSLGNSSNDTLKVVFLESNRKPSSLSYNLKPIGEYLEDEHSFRAQFNKPIQNMDSARYYFELDSTFRYPIQPQLTWNDNRTTLLIGTQIVRDSLINSLSKSLASTLPDTLSTDSLSETEEPTIELPKTIDFVVESNSFVSIENDTTKRKSSSVSLQEFTDFGVIKFTIETDKNSFTLQLLDSNNEVAYQESNNKQTTFPQVQSGTYTIRALIDNNEDGIWSPGNLILNIEPEQIYLHPEKNSVRSNWVYEIDISF